MVNAALDWARENPREIVPPVSPTVMEQRRLSVGVGEEDGWRGLVLVHAQRGIERLWKAWGFTRDHSMGEWDEEGIMHVGMWRRLKVE